MGLCKCPKKKVTNLFCFEHRVNVCEHCLVSGHDKCIVKSYLQWLQDSDYNPACTLCGKNLSDESNDDCVRLTCYDVFHFSCLHHYAMQLPSNTAPAGYTCPICQAPIFPESNMASPVASQLRNKLSTVNWARAGLGLPMVEEEAVVLPKVQPTSEPVLAVEEKITQSVGNSQALPVFSPALPNTTRPSAQVSPYNTTTNTVQHNTATSVINVDEGTSSRGAEKQNILDHRKLFDSTKEDLCNLLPDNDDDKYRRRPAMDWLNRWLRSRDTSSKRGMVKSTPMTVRKKFLVVLLIGVIGFLTMIVIFSKLGANSADDDPFLDIMANPNIRVGKA